MIKKNTAEKVGRVTNNIIRGEEKVGRVTKNIISGEEKD